MSKIVFTLYFKLYKIIKNIPIFKSLHHFIILTPYSRLFKHIHNRLNVNQYKTEFLLKITLKY